MPRSKSSQAWLKEHHDDHYVKQSKLDKFRSRAAYKLLEIQEQDRIFKPGQVVVDLGAAPGGWSQIITPLIGHHGRIFALDILPMDTLAGVEFIQGDFTDDTVYDKFSSLLGDQTIDIIVSDMAPNMSGVRTADQIKGIYLNELAVDFAQHHLKKGGDLLIKAFQGEGFDALLMQLKQNYASVRSRKPKASRSRSREMYLLARGKR